MSDQVQSPLEMFYRWERETPEQVYLRQPTALEWRDYTWREVADQVRRIANFLHSSNLYDRIFKIKGHNTTGGSTQCIRKGQCH